MKTTEEMSEIDRFLAWRQRLLKEHEDEPEWQREIWAFFLDLYIQTYPARSFPFVKELWGRYLDWHYKEVETEPDEDVRESGVESAERVDPRLDS